MIDQASIEARRALSAEIEAKVAVWEAENGPVQTFPIHTDDKRVPYRISCPERKEAAQSKARNKLVEHRSGNRKNNSERIAAMLHLGVPVAIICTRTGLSQRTVRRIIAEDGLKSCKPESISGCTSRPTPDTTSLDLTVPPS
jgi:hypothetical protein